MPAVGASLSSLEARLARLDARRRGEAPGQAALDLAAASTGPGGGQPCGQAWIDPNYTCHVGAGGGQAAAGGGAQGGATVPRAGQSAGAEAPDWSPAASKARAKGGLQFSRGRSGPHTLFRYRFRDRDAAEHWLAEDDAKSSTDMLAGPYDRRRREWQATYAKEYRLSRETFEGMDDRQLHDYVQTMAMSGKATRRGTAVEVKIGRGQQAPAATPQPPAPAAPVRPQRPPEPLTTQTAATAQQQAQLARQQQQQAAQVGDRRGQQAWREQERSIERQRVAAAMAAAQQTQAGLFGATEFDETLPLFRRDGDPTSSLLTAAIAEQLPGAQVLDWERPRPGIHSGRVTAEGLVYRFRTDSAGIAYRPAWEGLTEREWDARSAGFLAAREIGRRGDARRVNFEQRQGKRQCSIGYSCGRSCIAMAKECRVTPSSAIGKQRLKALEALAREGRPEAAQKATEVAAARGQKAGELREQRNVERLQRMLQDPQVAEMVRTGRVPTAEPEKRSAVQDVSPDEIEVDAQRFQYKIGASATGEVGSLSGVQRWDPNLAGVISVWEDPEDGKTYVINGHNRLALARRLGAEEITVRYLQAEDAQQARAIGAMQNIAEGAGTAIDAAKFFRDTGLSTLDQVRERGLPMNSGQAAQGLALQALPDGLFQAVVQGDLSINRGAIIGGSGLSQAKQGEVFRMLKQNARMTDGTLREYVAAAFVSETQQQGMLDVLGGMQTEDNLLQRSKLAAGLRSKLRREQRLFGTVSRSRAAEALESQAGNVINTEESARVSQQAAQVLGVFDQLKNNPGPVSDALNAAARRVKAGERESAVQRDLEQAVIGGVRDELRRLGMLQEERNPQEELGASMFDSTAARLDAIERWVIRLDRRRSEAPGQMALDLSAAGTGPGGGQPCGQAWIDPNYTCRVGAGGGQKVAGTGTPSLPLREAKREVSPYSDSESTIGIVTLSGGGRVEQQFEVVTRAPADTIRVPEAIATGRAPGQHFPSYSSAAKLLAVKQWADGNGLAIDHTVVDGYVQIKYHVLSFRTGPLGNAYYNRPSDLNKEDGTLLARHVFRQFREQLADLPNGTLCQCSAWSSDGLGAKRKSMYQALGFRTVGDDSHTLWGIVKDGKLAKTPRARKDSSTDPDEEAWVAAALELPEFGGPYGKDGEQVERPKHAGSG